MILYTLFFRGPRFFLRIFLIDQLILISWLIPLGALLLLFVFFILLFLIFLVLFVFLNFLFFHHFFEILLSHSNRLFRSVGRLSDFKFIIDSVLLQVRIRLLLLSRFLQ